MVRIHTRVIYVPRVAPRVYNRLQTHLGAPAVSHLILKHRARCTHVVPFNSTAVLQDACAFSETFYVCLLLCDLKMSYPAPIHPLRLASYRNKFNPLWNYLLIAGCKKDGTAFLGSVDHIG